MHMLSPLQLISLQLRHWQSLPVQKTWQQWHKPSLPQRAWFGPLQCSALKRLH